METIEVKNMYRKVGGELSSKKCVNAAFKMARSGIIRVKRFSSIILNRMFFVPSFSPFNQTKVTKETPSLLLNKEVTNYRGIFCHSTNKVVST